MKTGLFNLCPLSCRTRSVTAWKRYGWRRLGLHQKIKVDLNFREMRLTVYASGVQFLNVAGGEWKRSVALEEADSSELHQYIIDLYRTRSLNYEYLLSPLLKVYLCSSVKCSPLHLGHVTGGDG